MSTIDHCICGEVLPCEHLPIPCAKCGKRIPLEDAFEDTGTGDESGNVFYYCSEDCRDRH
jgi:hypothetical protein